MGGMAIVAPDGRLLPAAVDDVAMVSGGGVLACHGPCGGISVGW